ncbi:MAG TPA: PCRF domain-containing protein, partial [Bacillota bacterium]|nr:PCRF domain-containing protein [Bacillota bacterium]
MDHAVQQIAELEKEMADPGFWNDSDRAAATIDNLKSLKSRVDKYNAIYKEFEDLKVLLELAEEEEDDGALASEIQDSFSGFVERL